MVHGEPQTSVRWNCDLLEMSVQIQAKLICDTCGEVIEGPVETRSTLGMRSYWKAIEEAHRRHWMFMPRYGRHKHLCQKCADGVPATPVKK